MGVIVYELNEVPVRLFEFYATAFPKSSFAYLNKQSSRFITKTADVGGLSPWVTWPTLHRGVSNVEHNISDLGQDLSRINKEYPSIHEILADKGITVGMFGSLQSYPLPEDLNNYSFYVPDTFAAGDECFPRELSDFQSFNLSMVRANGRNVSKGVAVKGIANFLLSARKLGLTSSTFGKLTKQIINEQFNGDRVVRRRTSQAEIAFDLYFHQLQQSSPNISFFFTNHVASCMHRYWPTVFPEDYEEGQFDLSWRNQWMDEIPHAVKVANFQLSKLIHYAQKTDGELIVCSSMGQAAVRGTKKVKSQVLITDIKKLMKYLGFWEDEWEPRLAMAPQIVVGFKSSNFVDKIKKLDQVLINGKKIQYFLTHTGEIRFEIGLTNLPELIVTDNGTNISPSEIGIKNVDLQDAAGSYAYHVPEGILLHYTASKNSSKVDNENTWTEVSALDVAPSILAKFGKKAPSYMNKEALFIGSA